MSKEQKEAVALILILTACIVSACLMLIVKPRVGALSDNRESLKRIEGEISKKRGRSRRLLKDTEKMGKLEAEVKENASGLFAGLDVGDLSRVVNIIMALNFPSMRLTYEGDKPSVLPGNRYSELTNEFMIIDGDFHDLVKFISVLETSNPGIRVTNIEMKSADRSGDGSGLVTVGIGVSMVGMYESDDVGVPRDWEPDIEPLYNPTNLRNPFGPPGRVAVESPRMGIRVQAFKLMVTGKTSDSLLIRSLMDDTTKARECIVGKLMPVFEPAKVRLEKIAKGYFVVRCEDGKRFKIFVRQKDETRGGTIIERGTIKSVDEEK